MKIALIHTEYRASHLDKVVEQMKELGPPVIRAVWCEDRGFWAALEGCHRTRAADMLGLTPTIKPIEYRPGLTWSDIGMGRDFVAGAITLDKVVETAGEEIVIGFGEDRLPRLHEVRRPQPGEVMRYRIIKPINFDFGGRIVGGVGTEFTSEEAGVDVSDCVSGGYLEIVEEPEEKTTKEVLASPVRKPLGRPRKKA